ncbi:chondroitin sulfate N-acetylgalactosaminyltransferase 1-like [Salminus brasiliensis]|uniref:chondroitin sulfate N-acetylgalactosaminyltransferase 1-like n=1 Tax=Salminus brasiliensis TaxID=930266 RepID=UPI003B83137B
MLKRWFLGMVVRRGPMLVVALWFVSLLYFMTCRPHGNQKHQMSKGTMDDMKYQALLQEHEEEYQHYARSLAQQIFQLTKALQERTRQLQKSLEQSAVMLPMELEELGKKSNSELEMFFKRQLRHAEINEGSKLPNEHALVPFESFSLNRVYQLESGLTRHPVQGTLRSDLGGALEAALHILNDPQKRNNSQYRRIYSPQEFFEGIFRTERDKGTVYDLTFRDNTSLDFRRLLFFRPFAPLMKVKEEVIDTSNMLINIIVPLAERVETFRQFMHNFREVCLQQVERIHLTVVFFGREKMDEVRGIIDSTARKMRSRNFTLIHLNEKFSRGRGLDVGASAWKKSNALLFFCDVDVHFTEEFLHSCRMNAQPGKRVFYPIPFSQYNPDVIYGEHNIPSTDKQLVISKSTGFWQDFGFGMTCQYRSDFINIGGFDPSIKTWGKEDLHLYRKYLHSNIMVVRAPSRGLFHMWHERLCADDLSAESFTTCMQSKAMNEASHSQMGELLFHREINSHLHKYKLHENIKTSTK